MLQLNLIEGKDIIQYSADNRILRVIPSPWLKTIIYHEHEEPFKAHVITIKGLLLVTLSPSI